MIADFSPSGLALEFLPLSVSLLVAVCFIMYKRRHRKKKKIRAVFRLLFAPKTWLNHSTLLDFKYVFTGTFIFSSVVAYASFTGMQISHFVSGQLTKFWGAREHAPHVGIYSDILIALSLYIAYEFAYWLDHYLSHKIHFLWEFHKVHHSATTLTPFTNWRVHPVDTMLFLNIVALIVGSTHGILYYLMGDQIALATVSGTSYVVLIYMALYGHLQHSQLWIPFTGPAGKIFMSPAHHQIHHSTNPIHFNKNLGAGLALFDWIFGTLYVPSKRNENIMLGTTNDRHLKKLIPSTFYPFLHAWKHIKKMPHHIMRTRAS